MTRGEDIRATESYDLFDLDIKGLVGVYISETSTGKHLVYFRENGEWAELLESQFERVSPDKVPKHNMDFISRVRKLGE